MCKCRLAADALNEFIQQASSLEPQLFAQAVTMRIYRVMRDVHKS